MEIRDYAYLGDAVWELFVREHFINLNLKSKAMHDVVTSKVNAKFQHEMLNEIEKFLTNEEKEIVRRGRNLSIPIGRRAIQADYRKATAFETLIGYLYTHNKERLKEFEEILKDFL